MGKLNAPCTAVAKVLPFVRRAAAPATNTGVGTAGLFRPRIVACPAGPATPAAEDALEHDVRSALTSLRLIVSLLNEPEVLNAAYKQAGKDLQWVGNLLEGLFQELTASREGERTGGAAARTARKSRWDAKEARGADKALDGCTHILRAIAGMHVDVYVSAETRLPPLALSDDDFLRVLMNLVLNASEAMPGGGVIRVTARRALSREVPAVLLHVSDTGPGIPRAALQRIFEPGFTSKRFGPNSARSGLGLTILRDLLQRVGGSVEVASTRGRGTTFELRIPCLRTRRSKQNTPDILP